MATFYAYTYCQGRLLEYEALDRDDAFSKLSENAAEFGDILDGDVMSAVEYKRLTRERELDLYHEAYFGY